MEPNGGDGGHRYRCSRARTAVDLRPVLVNGVPGPMSWRPDGAPLSLTAFTVVEGRITGIHIPVDPAKLASIHLPAET